MAKVVQVTFDGHKEPQSNLVITTRGYPNEGIELAHDIAKSIFSDRGAWEFKQIVCIPPAQIGSKRDDEWQIETIAALKDDMRSRLLTRAD